MHTYLHTEYVCKYVYFYLFRHNFIPQSDYYALLKLIIPYQVKLDSKGTVETQDLCEVRNPEGMVSEMYCLSAVAEVLAYYHLMRNKYMRLLVIVW